MIIFFFQVVFCQNKDNENLLESEIGKEGIYLTCKCFLEKHPIEKNEIVTDLDLNDGEFYGKALSKPKLSFTKNGYMKTVYTDSVWGFIQNNTLYVNVQGRFYRVPVFGRISYFMAMVEVNQMVGAGIDPLTGLPVSVPSRTRELKEYILLFDAGCGPFPFNLEKIENELRKDEEVWNEYHQEKSKNRKKFITKYIRKYNAHHPLK